MFTPEPIFAAPTRAFRAMVAFLGHLALGGVVLFGIWLTEKGFHYFWGEADPLLWDSVPVRWLFDTADFGVLVVFILFGTYEAYEKLKGR